MDCNAFVTRASATPAIRGHWQANLSSVVLVHHLSVHTALCRAHLADLLNSSLSTQCTCGCVICSVVKQCDPTLHAIKERL